MGRRLPALGRGDIPAPLTTTTELLDSLRRGRDEPAWTLFVDRYRPVLVGVARRLGLGRDDADDVAQQTLLEFVRDFNAGRFDRSRGRLRAWILGILRHRAMDVHRLRRRGSRHPEDGAVVALTADGDDSDLEAAWQEQVDRRILEEALEILRGNSQISTRSVRAFELTALREVPPEAAAIECGMSVNAVYVARSRIAARLRRIAERLEPAYDERMDGA